MPEHLLNCAIVALQKLGKTMIQDTNRRLTPNKINEDIDALNGFKTLTGYSTLRAEATPEALTQAYTAMLAKQSEETAKITAAKAASDEARLAEWEFHNAVLAMKEVVRGQYGSDSNEAQTIGLKKKSERKRPSSRKNPSVPT